MDESTIRNQQGDSPVDSQTESQPTDFMDLIQERAFLGDISYDGIFSSLEGQFDDYMNIIDQTNYVDKFYHQLALSYDRVNSDHSEEHPNEIREALDLIYQKFIDLMRSLFETKLTVTITDLEAESIHKEDLEFIVRRLYEFFILDAKNNFKVVIASDIRTRLKDVENDDEYFDRLHEMIDDYSPLITTVAPMNFLRYRGDAELYDLFDNGQVCGNFLRKYSPKLYQNEPFRVELINYITMVRRFKQDIVESHNESIGDKEDTSNADGR